MKYPDDGFIALLRQLGRLGRLTLLLILALGALGCAPKGETRDDEEVAEQPGFVWEDQVVTLKVTASQMMLGERRQTSWGGTGIIVAPGLMVTNAHVAKGAVAIEATTDRSQEVTVTRVLALDEDNDLAVLAVDAPEAKDVALLERPAEPRTLRARPIVAIGNTAELGLSVYEGIVNNVSDAGYGEIIFHNADISSGSSGGPLFAEDAQTLIGVNHAISHGYRFSLAIPAWKVGELIEQARKTEGRALAEAFEVDASTALTEAETVRVCAQARRADRLVIPSQEGLDVSIGVQVEDPAKPFAYNLYYDEGDQLVRLGSSPTISHTSTLGFTTPAAGRYVLEIGHMGQEGAGMGCAEVTLGLVDWEQTLAAN